MINTLHDNPMQTSIDIVQGKHLNSGYSSEQRKFVDQQLRKLQDDFSVIDFIKLAVCSWNMGGIQPYEQQDLSSWLLPDGTSPNDLPDIFVIGLQHILPNKGSRMFGKSKNTDRVKFFQNNSATY